MTSDSKLSSHKFLFDHPHQPTKLSLEVFIAQSRFHIERLVTASKKLSLRCLL